MIVARGLPIKKFLNQALRAIVNRGHLDRFRQKWMLSKQECGTEKSVNPLGIKKLLTLFIIIATGLGSGLFIFMLEMFTNRCFQKNIKKADSDEFDDLSTHEIITMFNYFCKKEENFSIKVSHYINGIRATRELK